MGRHRPGGSQRNIWRLPAEEGLEGVPATQSESALSAVNLIEAGTVQFARCLHSVEQILNRTLQFLERRIAVAGDDRLHAVISLDHRLGNLRGKDTSENHMTFSSSGIG